jgi:hypothetical protein
MFSNFDRPFRLEGWRIARALLSTAFALALVAPGSAETVRKQCSEKYQAAKAGGTLNGQTWPQFYSQCAAEAKGGAPEAAPVAPAATPAAAPAAPPPANPLKPAPAAAPKPAPTAPAPASAAVFPTAVSPTYANEKPGKSRMKTCLDQYNANKATGANAGLKWSQKGGGYYSQCNARLKG